jgi:cysteine-rich repeat protein
MPSSSLRLAVVTGGVLLLGLIGVLGYSVRFQGQAEPAALSAPRDEDKGYCCKTIGQMCEGRATKGGLVQRKDCKAVGQTFFESDDPSATVRQACDNACGYLVACCQPKPVELGADPLKVVGDSDMKTEARCVSNKESDAEDAPEKPKGYVITGINDLDVTSETALENAKKAAQNNCAPKSRSVCCNPTARFCSIRVGYDPTYGKDPPICQNGEYLVNVNDVTSYGPTVPLPFLTADGKYVDKDPKFRDTPDEWVKALARCKNTCGAYYCVLQHPNKDESRLIAACTNKPISHSDVAGLCAGDLRKKTDPKAKLVTQVLYPPYCPPPPKKAAAAAAMPGGLGGGVAGAAGLGGGVAGAAGAPPGPDAVVAADPNDKNFILNNWGVILRAGPEDKTGKTPLYAFKSKEACTNLNDPNSCNPCLALGGCNKAVNPAGGGAPGGGAPGGGNPGGGPGGNPPGGGMPQGGQINPNGNAGGPPAGNPPGGGQPGGGGAPGGGDNAGGGTSSVSNQCTGNECSGNLSCAQLNKMCLTTTAFPCYTCTGGGNSSEGPGKASASSLSARSSSAKSSSNSNSKSSSSAASLCYHADNGSEDTGYCCGTVSQQVCSSGGACASTNVNLCQNNTTAQSCAASTVLQQPKFHQALDAGITQCTTACAGNAQCFSDCLGGKTSTVPACPGGSSSSGGASSGGGGGGGNSSMASSAAGSVPGGSSSKASSSRSADQCFDASDAQQNNGLCCGLAATNECTGATCVTVFKAACSSNVTSQSCVSTPVFKKATFFQSLDPKIKECTNECTGIKAGGQQCIAECLAGQTSGIQACPSSASSVSSAHFSSQSSGECFHPGGADDVGTCCTPQGAPFCPPTFTGPTSDCTPATAHICYTATSLTCRTASAGDRTALASVFLNEHDPSLATCTANCRGSILNLNQCLYLCMRNAPHGANVCPASSSNSGGGGSSAGHSSSVSSRPFQCFHVGDNVEDTGSCCGLAAEQDCTSSTECVTSYRPQCRTGATSGSCQSTEKFLQAKFFQVLDKVKDQCNQTCAVSSGSVSPSCIASCYVGASATISACPASSSSRPSSSRSSSSGLLQCYHAGKPDEDSGFCCGLGAVLDCNAAGQCLTSYKPLCRPDVTTASCVASDSFQQAKFIHALDPAVNRCTQTCSVQQGTPFQECMDTCIGGSSPTVRICGAASSGQSSLNSSERASSSIAASSSSRAASSSLRASSSSVFVASSSSAKASSRAASSSLRASSSSYRAFSSSSFRAFSSSLRANSSSGHNAAHSSSFITDYCRLFPERCVSTSSVPTGPVCGNGRREGTERCDDGNRVDTDACTNDCRLGNQQRCVENRDCGTLSCVAGVCAPCTTSAQCGGNQCVAGKCVDTCGNGTLDAGEVCDDGNRVGTDSCSNDCRPTNLCGNGVVNAGEFCDDGNTNDGDGCTADCHLPRNGACDNPVQCDSGICNAGHCLDLCGNGRMDPGEQCDDGNILSNDGCSNKCLLETGVGAQIVDIPVNGGTNPINNPVPGTQTYTPGNPIGQTGQGNPQNGSLTPIATGHAPAGKTGPAAVAVMAAGAASGLAWMRRKRS